MKVYETKLYIYNNICASFINLSFISFVAHYYVLKLYIYILKNEFLNKSVWSFTEK
jgi:hypothetical protein